MKKFYFFAFFLGLILVFGFFFLTQKSVFLMSGISWLTLDTGDFSVLLLGKPGPGHIGSENTDSIVVVYYQAKTNKVFLIPIPRDLIVSDSGGNLEKINALYGKNKIDLLLAKASEFTGLQIKNYLAVDLKLITDVVDFFGGIEIDLDQPVVDAASLYTIPAGRQKLNGDLVELVLRSRYNREGDFFRVKNQMKVVMALKDKIANLNTQEKLSLVKFFFEKDKYYWQTNLTKSEIFTLATKISDIQNLKIISLALPWPNSLLTSGSFNIYNSYNVYGIYPKTGIDNYEKLRLYFGSQISQN
jgi:LCP family protein required for cell wall assembly